MASSQAASTARTPGASTATGFSAKMCLPASTAALKCSGRKPGGVVSSTTSTLLAIHLLVGVEAGEATLAGHIDFGGEATVVAQFAEAALDAVGEGVAHGDELDVRVGAEGLAGGAGATTAAADQADFEGIAAGGMDGGSQRQGGH